MFLKKRQTAVESDAEPSSYDEEEDLNNMYEEDNEEMNEETNEETEEQIEDEDDVSSSDDEKTLSFAERLALSQYKSKESEGRKKKEHFTTATSHKRRAIREEKEPKEIVKKNKNAPKEVSSKIKPKNIPDIASRLGYVKKKSRDPRFDASLNTDPNNFKQFSHNYNHVFEKLKDDIDELRGQLKDKSLSWEERNDIQREISRLQTRNKKIETQTAVADVKKQFYEREKKLVAEKGKNPFFLKDSDVKKILKQRKMDTIRSSGKMNKFIKKTRRNDKSKVAGLMPTTRR